LRSANALFLNARKHADRPDLNRLKATYTSIQFRDEKHSVVRAASGLAARRRENIALSLASVVVCHLDLRERIARVYAESCLRGLLSLEVHVGAAVDGQHLRDVLRQFVLHDGTLDKHTPDRSELLEDGAYVRVGHSVGQARHKQVRFLLV